jgi:hypothetical protein
MIKMNNWLVGSNMIFIFHFIYGMSSFPLTNSYFSEGWLNHQPEHVKELVLEAILAAIVSLVESWISVGFLKKMISSPWLS